MSKADPSPELTRLGSYEIVRKLAKGGMAELFLARSVGPEGFEKLVVLKKILPRYSENPRFVQLFLDEAKLAASFDHPHIVHVYDMGRVDGHYFFTMEYVHGQDARTILKYGSRTRHDLPIPVSVQIARNVASALHHAHERRHPDGTLRNIVHRDVSPSNILVSYDGAIKLADFGVAKASTSSVRTRTGALKGKVGYMSPEQARGASIDRRSDIFSLGVVLWEMVTMRRLFKSENDLATIQAIINTTPPSLLDHRPDCPPELDRIVHRALEKSPDDRYQTAQELQHDLDELVREERLEQSSIVVGNFMQTLFAHELEALRAAERTGVTANEYLASHSQDLSSPISESELSLEDPGDEPEFDPDDELDGVEDEVEVDDAEFAKPSPEELAPRAGSIHQDDDYEDDATDFGPPPTMDEIAASNIARAPKPSAPLPSIAKPSAPLPSIAKSSAPLPSIAKPKAPKLPPASGAATIPDTPTVPAESEPVPDAPPPGDAFDDDLATRLRMAPIKEPFDAAATSISSPAFQDEAPTVNAPPELVKQAFAEAAETQVAGEAFNDAPSGFEKTAVASPESRMQSPSITDAMAATEPPLPHAPTVQQPAASPHAVDGGWSPDEDLPSPKPAGPAANWAPDAPSAVTPPTAVAHPAAQWRPDAASAVTPLADAPMPGAEVWDLPNPQPWPNAWPEQNAPEGATPEMPRGSAPPANWPPQMPGQGPPGQPPPGFQGAPMSGPGQPPGQPGQPPPGYPPFQQPGQPMPGHPGAPMPGQPGQPMPGPAFQQPGQPGQPMPGHPAFQQPGQPMPGQPGQPMPGHPAFQQPGQPTFHPAGQGPMPPGNTPWPQPGQPGQPGQPDANWPPQQGAWPPGQTPAPRPPPVRAPTGSEPLDPSLLGGVKPRLEYPVVKGGHGTATPLAGVDLDVDLVPNRRWLLFAGIAVVVAVIAIVLVLLLVGNNDSEDEVAPDAATESAPATDKPPLPSKTPSGKVTSGSGSVGSASSTNGSADGSAASKDAASKDAASKDAASNDAASKDAASNDEGSDSGSDSGSGSASGSASGSDAPTAAPARHVTPAKRRRVRPWRRRRRR